jgi:hypothetical protein
MNESIVTTTMPTIARWRRSSAKKAGEYSEEDMVPHGIFEELISCSEMRPRAYTFGLPSPTNWDVWQDILCALQRMKSVSLTQKQQSSFSRQI